MNGDRFGGELHAWIEPELEARLVALILGEASAFEAEEMERMMRERPELRIFKRRLEAVHSLMGEAVRPPDAEKWRMAPERRSALMETLGIEAPEEPSVVPIDAGRERRVRRAGLKVAVMAAACFLISLVLAPFLLRGVKSSFVGADSKMAEPESVSYAHYDAEDAPEETMQPGYADRPVNGLGRGEGQNSVGDKLAALKQNLGTTTFAIETDDYASGADGTVELKRVAGRRGVVLENKPASSSSAAKVIAATTPAPTAIPVPDVESPEPSVDFGSGDSFGDGWGSGGGGGAGSFGNGRVSGRGLGRAASESLEEIVDRVPADMPAEPMARPKKAPAKPSAPAPPRQESESKSVTLGLADGSRQQPAAGKPTKKNGKGVPTVDSIPFYGALFSRNSEEETAKESGVAGGSEHWNRSKSERESRRSQPTEVAAVELEALRKKTSELASKLERAPEDKSRSIEGFDGDDEFVREKSLRKDKDESGRKLAIKTKSLDVKQANTEELDMDWEVQDESKKVDSDGTFVGGGAIVDGRARTRNARDFVPPAKGMQIPGIPAAVGLNVNGVVTDTVNGGLKKDLGAVSGSAVRGDLRENGELNERLMEEREEDEGFEGEVEVGQTFEYAWRGTTSGKKLQDADGDGVSNKEEFRNRAGGAARGPSTEDQKALAWFDQQGQENNKTGDSTDRPHGGRSFRMKSGAVAAGELDAEESTALPALGEGKVAQAQILRRQGRYREAEVALNDALKVDPDNAYAKNAKEALDDPIRTNPALSYEHAKDVDKSWELAVPPAPGRETAESGGEKQKMATKTWKVPSVFLSDIQGEGGGGGDIDPFAADAGGGLGGGLEARKPMGEALKDAGISLPEGAVVTFDPGSGTLMVTSTASDLGLIDAMTAPMGVNETPPVDYKGLYEPLDTGWDFNEEDLKITHRLKTTILPEVNLSGMTVEQAVRFFEEQSAEFDQAELGDRGIDFDIRKPRIEEVSYGVDTALDAEAGLGTTDPGLTKIEELKLRNVPLATALQYVADQAGLRYKVENGTVTLVPLSSGEGNDPLTRRWKLHPDVLAELQDKMMQNAHDDQDPFANAEDRMRDSLAQMTATRKELIEIFKDAGISFPPGTSVSYLENSQTLLVNNTPGNLELVDVLVEQVAAKLASERQAMKANEKHALQEAFSTFSLHVSDVSFKLAQAALAKGEWPDAARIRVEEFVNAFDYGDPAPSQNEKVACALEQAAHPFMQQRNMLRISMRTAAVGRAAGTPLRLTVLLDNSGSMERSDRAESVQRAFALLAAQMNPQDEVTLISFARKPRLVRDSVPGNKAGELVQLIRDTPSEGGTNLEEALRLGVEKAQEDFLEGAQNRIILLTDGAANLGNAEPELLGAMVEKMRQQGIAFDACGVGADGLNDDVLEALTRKGDGRYYFLDRPEDADAGFARQIAGALRPAAKNVKVQVEFNPKRVGHYRLYGFEKHELKKEDFRDDSVDAAEMAAEEAGVAMYQVQTLPDGEGDVGSVSVRFMDMATGEMVEKRWPIPYEANPARLEEAAPSMKLAASAAFLGEKLKGTPVGELVELGDLSAVSRSLQPVYASDARVGQLIEMIEKAREMGR